jgi:hypothetical protein
MRPSEVLQQQQQQQNRWNSSTSKKNDLLLKYVYSIEFYLVSMRQPPPLLPPINGQIPRV